MEKTKRSFLRRMALLLALVMAASCLLTACGETEEEPPVDPSLEEVEVQPEPVEIPVDFEAAQSKWPDVYACIRIPNATRCTISDEMGYFIAQHATDDGYYLYRDLDGKDARSGTLYTEKEYNGTDLSDPVTVIYGHNMANRTMFGGLQSYAETVKFDDDAVIYIYQPGRQLTYRIFAGVPYDTSHVLYYHDFTDEAVFNEFFQSLAKAADDSSYTGDDDGCNAFYSAEGCVNVDKDNLPEAGDKVIILATCKNGDNNHRYFIMAKLVEDSAQPLVMTRGEAEEAGVTDRILEKTDDATATADTAKKD